MRSRKPSYAPRVESLEGRRLFRVGAVSPAIARATPARIATIPPETFGAHDTVGALRNFTDAYVSFAGGPRFNPVFDLDHNGMIGQGDRRILLRVLPAVAPPRPLNLRINLIPQDQARGSLPANSGGVTFNPQPTVVGRTVPGALIFSGTGETDWKLRGPAAVSDERGFFTFTPTLDAGINQFDVQVVDRYGHQLPRSLPIRWLGFNPDAPARS